VSISQEKQGEIIDSMRLEFHLNSKGF